ncbi:hypothetical protein BLNAU_20573 [Blattamonas nauphoetae]|uniref:Uncharacterized protein n=1 Tax=Blattamonas nauphoetae TaxID=2049346 RepID=A0ABQ9WYD6_9EUKA|nr:hypothetical protein BLNAU_20573 [Blattamonas nauphoetae]
MQTKEHRRLNSQIESTSPKPITDLNERLLHLQTTMCNTTAQMTEQLGKINSWMMQYDSILRSLDENRRSDLLRESRFQRWSKTGAAAIELFDEDFIIKTGDTFTLRERPEIEQTNFVPKTLFSPIISSDVAQLSFSITHSVGGYSYGAISANLIDTGTRSDICSEQTGRACWRQPYEPAVNLGAAEAPLLRHTGLLVLEADCRDGRRTVKLLMGRKVYSVIYVNLTLPFRFVITLLHPTVSVTVKSLTFTAKPTQKGGRKEYDFLE